MAAKQPPASKSKPARRVRPAPTVREQSQKVEAKAGKSSGGRTVRRILGAPFRALGRGFTRLNKIKVFRIIGYIVAPPYFRNSWRELRQVSWPDRRTTLRLTFAVAMFSLVFGLIVFGVDYGLDKVFKKVILKQ